MQLTESIPPTPAIGPSLRSTRSSLLLLSGLLLTLFLIVAIALVKIAWQQNHAALVQSRGYASKAIENQLANMAASVSDYAFWGEAYQHLHTQVDENWAYTRQNMGPSLYEDFNFEGLLVVGPEGSTTYTVIHGQLSNLSAERWLGQEIQALVAQARQMFEEEKPLTAILAVGGQPALVAAAPLTPGGDPTVQALPGPPSVVLFVSLLTPDKLVAVGDDFDVRGLRLADQNVEAQGPWLSLTTPNGQRLDLTWDAPRPGKQLLTFLLPLLLFTGALCAGLTWAILRRAINTARAVDASYSSLEESRAALERSESRFRDVAEASSDWIWETDAELVLTYLSDRFAKVTGHPPSEWVGRPITDFLRCPASLSTWLGGATGRSPGGDSWQCYYAAKDGRRRVCRVSQRYIETGPLAGGYRGTARDVTEEVEARAKIEHLSQHDALTGLPNRNRLQQFLDGKLRGVPTEAEPLVMLSIDLDRFKPVNDSFGHEAGDRVLNEVASRLRSCLSEDDLVARLGGDEFILIVTGLTAEQDISRLCERLINTIERVIEFRNQRIFISASIGVAIAPMDTTNAADLLRYADIALYEAKGAGRKTWCFYASHMNERIIERHQLERDLRQAVRDEALDVVLQPRYRIDTEQMVAAEALVRWHHPVRGQLRPDIFIPIAEDAGLIQALSSWVMRCACREAVGWNNTVRVSVNISPTEFRRGDLVGRVREVLTETGLAAERLELEVTESVMLEDADRALTVMLDLKALGVRLAMDDFGTGYSSLSYLSNFPFDGLKIDRAFIAGLGQSASSQAIIEAVIALGKALDMTITAEGVETAEQLDRLRALGCFEAQGYFLDRPMPIAQLRAILASRQSGKGD